MLAIKRGQFINKKNFAKTALYKESKTFIIHIAALKTLVVEITTRFSKTTQITSSNLV